MSIILHTTSSTRPAHAAGRIAFETDTGNLIISDGTYWRGFGNDGMVTELTQGISLDGTDDYATIPDDSALAISGNLSIACWVYLDTAKYTPLVSKRVASGGTTNYDFAWKGDQSSKVLNFYDGTYANVSTDTISTGGWNHVAVVIDSGTSTTFYINGNSSSATGNTINITADSSDLNFGHLAATAHFLHGKMDDVAIYNRVLTSTEVNNIKDGTFPTNGLAGLWTFEGDTGSSFTDKSGNGNHGTLESGASLVAVTNH